MKQAAYTIKHNVLIKNTRSGETLRGSVVDEEQIDDKKYWVIVPDNRPGSRLRFSKDAWNISKGK